MNCSLLNHWLASLFVRSCSFAWCDGSLFANLHGIIIDPFHVTSHHVTLRTGGQASVCLQHGGESDYEAWVVTRLF